MEPGHVLPSADGGEGPSSSSSSSSAATAAVTTTTDASRQPMPVSSPQPPQRQRPQPAAPQHQQLSRYESQKKRDWNNFLQYLKNHKPPLTLARCSGPHVIEFLKYLDQFGKTRVHADGCAHFGVSKPPATCACPLKQAWGSLDALIGRLRAAYEENGGRQESNPFGDKAVRVYLREVKENQAKARGIPFEKKKRKRPPFCTAAAVAHAASGEGSSGSRGGESSSPHPTAPETPADAGGTRTSSAAVDSTSGGGTSSPATGEGTDEPPARVLD